MNRIAVGLASLALLAGCASAATPTPSPSPSIAPSASPAALPVPTSLPGSPSPVTSAPAPTGSIGVPPVQLPADALAVTVTEAVRVRSQPRVSDDSIKYEPVLPLDTHIQVLEGPVAGSGYWWYRIELEGQTLYDGVGAGWVASADHDGTPWIRLRVDVDPGPPLPSPLTGWPTVEHDGIRLTGHTAWTDNSSSLEINVEVLGLLPGTVDRLAAEGTYHVGWMCGGGPDDGELGSSVTDAGSTHGSATATIDVVVDAAGIGKGVVLLKSAEPDKACPSAFPGPLMTWSARWAEVRIVDGHHGLVLAPDPYEWGTVM